MIYIPALLHEQKAPYFYGQWNDPGQLIIPAVNITQHSLPGEYYISLL